MMQSLRRSVIRNLTVRAPCPIRNMSAAVTLRSSIKLCVLGGGNMAEAIISALSKSEVQNMADIVVIDVSEERIEHLQNTYKVRSCKTLEEGMLNADVTLLSVKPQNVDSIAAAITTAPKGLILSIVAGCTIDHLKEVFKTNNIVRSMPNTPAMVMEAMTVWVATKETPAELVGNYCDLIMYHSAVSAIDTNLHFLVKEFS